MEWINILEQFPGKEQEIIVYFKNSAGWHVTSTYWDGKTFIELCERCGYGESWGYQAIVSHWMPMLDPPQLV